MCTRLDREQDTIRRYILDGLKVAPLDLRLSMYYVEVTANVAKKQGKLDSSLVEQLLDVTAMMEKANQDYAPRYLVRGNLLLEASRWQDALTAYEEYIRHSSLMNETWRKANEENLKGVRQRIAMCSERAKIRGGVRGGAY